MNRTERLRRQALCMLAHRTVGMPETPREPTPAEEFYIKAREMFEVGEIAAGRYNLAEGDKLSGLS